MSLRIFDVLVEKDPETGLFVGSVPGWPGAHSQGATLDELDGNLREAIAMLLEDGDPELESELVGLQTTGAIGTRWPARPTATPCWASGSTARRPSRSGRRPPRRLSTAGHKYGRMRFVISHETPTA